MSLRCLCASLCTDMFPFLLCELVGLYFSESNCGSFIFQLALCGLPDLPALGLVWHFYFSLSRGSLVIPQFLLLCESPRDEDAVGRQRGWCKKGDYKKAITAVTLGVLSHLELVLGTDIYLRAHFCWTLIFFSPTRMDWICECQILASSSVGAKSNPGICFWNFNSSYH